jgi:hypothetical protein
MSTKEREPLLGDAGIHNMLLSRSTVSYTPSYAWTDGAHDVRDLYEAARAKDAELIQMAVNLTHQRVYEWTDEKFRAVLCNNELAFLSAAKEAGFTPSEP